MVKLQEGYLTIKSKAWSGDFSRWPSDPATEATIGRSVKFKNFTEQHVDSLASSVTRLSACSRPWHSKNSCVFLSARKQASDVHQTQGKNWKRGPNRKCKSGTPSRSTLWRRRKPQQA